MWRRTGDRASCSITARSVSLKKFEDVNVTITRVGTNQKYATGWDSAFAGKKSGTKAPAKAAATKPAKKASPKKKASAAPKKKAKK